MAHKNCFTNDVETIGKLRINLNICGQRYIYKWFNLFGTLVNYLFTSKKNTDKNEQITFHEDGFKY
jgi:hypothetical protein